MRQRMGFRAVGLGLACLCHTAAVEGQSSPRSFLAAKTVLQTNSNYDPRIAIAVDGVIVHQHGAAPESLAKTVQSWKQAGFCVGRMFFADSDATNEYWTGKWDGTPHPDEVERDEKGEVVKCSGVRPYMLPTEGWIRYLEEMAVESVDAGADAVLPEEPLAHVHTGYEEAFRRLWVQRYHRPWEAQSASPEARFLTAQLKNELYVKLEGRLAEAVARRARQLHRDVAFVMPVHGIYSNVASTLVAPLGTSTAIGGVDGYIGQVWTGPVNWTLHHYDSPDKSFFASAYVLYDYFVQLAAGSNRKLWLLVDPVEDDPKHDWSEFEAWYCHCVAAQLMFPQVASYEVMPWPDRIFLPGQTTGGGTPAPERFRAIVLSATQVLQEVAPGGEWSLPGEDGRQIKPTEGIGVAIADTLMWEAEPFPPLQVMYGMLMPLVHAGVPVSACVMERAGEPGYLSRFKTIVLSYEAWKPVHGSMNAALVKWVRSGGVLVLLGSGDAFEGPSFCWRASRPEYASPVHQLMAALDIDETDKDGEHAVGRGWVLRRVVSPRGFGDPAVARSQYLPVLELALEKAGAAGGLVTPGRFCLRRGPFVVAHATRTAIKLNGTFVDVFDPQLSMVEDVVLEPGSSGLYRDAGPVMSSQGAAKQEPCVLHATHRLMSERYRANLLRVVIRGPAETPALVRVFTSGKQVRNVAVRDAAGDKIDVTWKEDGATGLARFANDPRGATLEVRWK